MCLKISTVLGFVLIAGLLQDRMFLLFAISSDPRCAAPHTNLYPMVSDHTKEVFILGRTHEGRTFRPSDWAERLAGVMSQFRPGGATPDSYISYSPWCVPNTLDGNKCVIVHTDLREEEPMAWDFVMNFAKDNGLQILEACLLPDPPEKTMTS